MKIIAISTEGFMAAMPVIALIMCAIMAGVLLATINFGFGGKTTFWQAFAVVWYAGLPGLVKFILGTIALFAGLAPESFNVNNFSGTNLGYFLPPETSKPLLALATSIDVTTIWTLVLCSIGISIVAGVKRSSGYIAVFGWWLVLTLMGVGAAAAFS
jgi:Yip1 domain